MLDACASMPAFAKDPYLVNEIAFLQGYCFCLAKITVRTPIYFMKSYLFTAVIFLSIAHKKCSKQQEPTIPSCIQTKIDEIRKQPRWNPPALVEEYSYNGRRIFLFSSNCCDQFNEAVDEACNYVCAPTGGYTGKGDRKCEDFKQNAKFIKLVWKDERQ